MNTCKTCKHWEQGGEDQWPVGDSAGSCILLAEGSLDGTDSDVRVHCDCRPITTEHNFGCIHWAERMEPSKEAKDAL